MKDGSGREAEQRDEDGSNEVGYENNHDHWEDWRLQAGLEVRFIHEDDIADPGADDDHYSLS